MTKKLIWTGVAVMATLLALGALWQFRSVLVIVLISLALAATVRPLAQRWARQKLIVRIALALVFVLGLGGTGLLLVVGGGSAISEIRQLANTVAVRDAWVLPEWLPESSSQPGSGVPLAFANRLPPPSQLFAALTGEEGQMVLPAILGLTRGITGLISSLVIVLFLSLYWSLNQVQFERLWLSLLPPGQRKQTRYTWNTIEADLGAYIRSQILQSLLAGLLLGLGYWALGSPYPTLLGLAGALASLIPMVGLGLAVILPLSIGLLTSLQLSLLTAGYTLVVLIALNIWLKPRLFDHRQYNPILTIVILIALANAFGFIGIIAAPPLSAAIQILWSHLAIRRSDAGPACQISNLKERHGSLAEAVALMHDPPPLVTSSLAQLGRLIEKAEPVLEAAQAVETSGAHPNYLLAVKDENIV
jgi:putative permease